MQFDAVDERVVVDRACVGGTLAQRLAVGLARFPDVFISDRRERDELDGVDLDPARADAVAAALLDLRPLSEPDSLGPSARLDLAGRRL